MPSYFSDIVPIAIVMAGFLTGFYVRHRISLKRQKSAKHSFFKQI